jgi:hypothetical protein
VLPSGQADPDKKHRDRQLKRTWFLAAHKKWKEVFLMTSKFSFSHELLLTEDQYVAIWRSAKSSRRWKMLISQSVIAIVVLVLSLLSAYTTGLGIALALFFFYLGTIGFFPPQILRKTFRDLRYISDPITYSVTQKDLSVASRRLHASATWDLLVTWQIVGDWLILRASDIPQLYFPVERLKQLDMFDKVLGLAKRNGKEFA